MNGSNGFKWILHVIFYVNGFQVEFSLTFLKVFFLFKMLKTEYSTLDSLSKCCFTGLIVKQSIMLKVASNLHELISLVKSFSSFIFSLFQIFPQSV